MRCCAAVNCCFDVHWDNWFSTCSPSLVDVHIPLTPSRSYSQAFPSYLVHPVNKNSPQQRPTSPKTNYGYIPHINQPPGIHGYTLLIKKLTQFNDLNQVHKCIQMIDKKGLTLDTHALNAILQAFLQLRDRNSMNEWIRELEEGGKYSHLLDAHSCSIIMRFFLRIEPDVVILTDLLCKQGMSEGIHILSKLCERKLKFVKSGFLVVLLDQYLMKRTQTSVSQFFQYIYLLLEAGIDIKSTEGGKDIWSGLRSSMLAFSPQEVTSWLNRNPKHARKVYNLLISAYAIEQDFSQMRVWHDRMTSAGHKEDADTHNIYLNYLSAQNTDKTLNWFDSLRSRQTQLDDESFAIILRLLIRSGNLSRIQQLLTEMSEEGRTIHPHLASNLLEFFMKHSDDIDLKKFEMVVKCTGGVSIPLFNQMLLNLTKKNPAAVERWFENADRMGLQPDVDTYDIMARYYNSMNDGRGVYRSICKMIDSTNAPLPLGTIDLTKKWGDKEVEHKREWEQLKAIAGRRMVGKKTLWLDRIYH
ncbi:hypothetical protein PROFUN_06830 [Planoprotostelium fungivorum]|uniref:Pentatricopeptide repeat-containing protein n=1 Tax=Planoprotostelium fungivorum TaxID=1890364 RepID=A0A2P6NNC5_9EUKA|nr:hypothetical protein PROFUN_06830 [Planoprotostelium fungivorum]